MKSAWTRSGGVSYHLRAINQRYSTWAPFFQIVRKWLVSDWRPTNTRLVIFGSSAGWSLPLEFLSQFNSIVIVEPDPLARMIFTFRFRHLKKLEFLAVNNLLPWFDKEECFEKFIEAERNSAFLFSNLLGQIAFHLDFQDTNSSREESNRRFLKQMKDQTWASYHDVLSSPTDFSWHHTSRENSPKVSSLEPWRIDAQNSKTLNIEDLTRHWIKWQNNHRITINDHDTLWLSKGRTTEFAPWHFKPNYHHLIGWTMSANQITIGQDEF